MTLPDVLDFTIEPLSANLKRDSFSCGNADLDRYFHQQAGQEARKHLAAPFILWDPKNERIAGYYTLSMNSILTCQLPAELAKKLPKYEIMPAVLLGRLAVDQRYRGQGLGEFLLLDALHRSLKNPIAAMAVVVDAIDNTAQHFYEHYGFLRLSDTKRRLFLPMKTVEKLFQAV